MVFLPERKEDDIKLKANPNQLDEIEARKREIKKDFKDRVSILAVAYHNLGVE